jgi:hypothetical protein
VRPYANSTQVSWLCLARPFMDQRTSRLKKRRTLSTAACFLRANLHRCRNGRLKRSFRPCAGVSSSVYILVHFGVVRGENGIQDRTDSNVGASRHCHTLHQHLTCKMSRRPSKSVRNDMCSALLPQLDQIACNRRVNVQLARSRELCVSILQKSFPPSCKHLHTVDL